jgi:hypothetical protein
MPLSRGFRQMEDQYFLDGGRKIRVKNTGVARFAVFFKVRLILTKCLVNCEIDWF